MLACAPPNPVTEVEAYLYDASFRREVLERDLVSLDNDYARARLERYAMADGWDALPERDPISAPLTATEVDALREGAAPTLEPEASSLLPDVLPRTDAEWIALGRRVWMEMPFVGSTTLLETARAGMLEQHGVLTWGERTVGVRVLEDEGRIGLGPTCALCHATLDADGPSAVRANRGLALGAMRLLAREGDAQEGIGEVETSAVAQLERLLPGHSDPLADGRFNPYAFPDLGGIADLPYLHHTANWINASTTTLAIRVETVFITASGQRSRIPRELAWAAAMYLRSLPPPAPTTTLSEAERAAGRAVFEGAGCDGCHPPPLFTSDRLVTVEEVGTDPAAGLSEARGTGYYRIPSLRGVGGAGPYLHHGAVPSLEVLFEPERAEPGHRYGLELSAAEREALVAYLRSL